MAIIQQCSMWLYFHSTSNTLQLSIKSRTKVLIYVRCMPTLNTAWLSRQEQHQDIQSVSSIKPIFS